MLHYIEIAPREPKCYQAAMPESLTVGVMTLKLNHTHICAGPCVQHCKRKAKNGANGECVGMAECGGISRGIQQGQGSQNGLCYGLC